MNEVIVRRCENQWTLWVCGANLGSLIWSHLRLRSEVKGGI